jgi:serine/threonine-protein kinase
MAAIPAAAEAHRKGPSLAAPLAFFGGLFDEIGPPEVARRYLERAAETDPSSGFVLVPLLRTLYFLGENDEARRRVAASADAHNFPIVGALCTRLSIWSGDRSWLPSTGLDQIANWPLTAMLSDVVEHGGVRAETLAGVRELRVRGNRFWRFACQLASETLAASGDPQAFDWLQASLDVGLHDLVWMDRCPSLDRLRGDPRFAPMHSVVRERAEALRAALAREGHG